MGAALSYARRHFAHGQWQKYLEQLGIEKTRASKARAIFRTFSREEKLNGISVDEAYRHRKRKQSTNSHEKKSRSKNSPLPGMEDFLRDVCEKFVAFQDESKGLSPESARNLLPAVNAVVGELLQLGKLLQDRCKSSP